ncbi:MAG: 2-hydroxyacyl-CoA dehydratase family protein, partial [Clostridiales bacterium]|nr:2-hydroxyacyl-CoA dehydratase family protein [Clostridiales bacterium]
ACRLPNMQPQRRPDRRLRPARRYAAVMSMDSVLGPLRRPERSAVVNIFLPCEILHAMDIRPQIAEGVSCYTAGAGSEQAFVAAAHEAGVPESLCSYHKILTGAALSGVLPKPRFIANTTMACDANLNTFRLLAEHYQVPHFVIDCPYDAGEESVRYVADQLREMTAGIEDVMGMRCDAARLRESVACARRSQEQYREMLARLPEKYFVNELTSEMYTLFAAHVLLGSPEAEEYFRLLNRDCAAAPDDPGGNRLLWVHSMPYWQDSLRELLNCSEKNQLLCSDMTFDALAELDEDKPYESMARRIVYNTFNGAFERRAETVLERARALRANGIVYFCHWGCRATLGGVRIMQDMAREAGIPLLVLDGDGCDRKNINDGQMLTRMEAFLELLGERS